MLMGMLSAFFCVGSAFATSASENRRVQANQLPGEISQELVAESLRDYQACFVLFDPSSQQVFCYNPQLCSTRMSPCSTFKIFNALVGLETGVVEDENHSMLWDGTKYEIGEWNRNHTLQSAMTNSVVWYFQRLASQVGEARMKDFVQRAQYGNEDISGGITKFWLGSTLKISAEEQVKFLKRLVNYDLPFSERSMAIVRGLIRLEQSQKGTLYGKTGSDYIDSKSVLGWFVGYLVQPEHTYVFTTNIQAADGASGKQARQLTLEILTKAGLL